LSKEMGKIRIKLVKSGIDRPECQKRTLKALGLTKVNRTVEVEATPQVKGMVHAVNHLIQVEEI
jgi:large subunit ribosomal protein L30